MAESRILFPAIPITYDGKAAAHNLMDMQQLAASLSGYSRMYNAASHAVFTGKLLLPHQRPAGRLQFYVSPFRKGSFPFDIVPQWTGGEITASEVVAALGTDFISKIVAYVFSLTGGKQSSAEFDAMADLANKIVDNDLARQEMQLAAELRRQESMQGFLLRYAEVMRPAAIDAVAPIGRSCDTISDGKQTIDYEMAKAIRQIPKVKVGDVGPFLVKIDGIHANDHTCKLYVLPDEQHEVSGMIVDPEFENWPDNIYKEAIRNGTLKVTAKPTLKDGQLQKLTILDAEWAAE